MGTQSLLWFDLETTGRDPARDRILQFAGQRTTLDFEPIGDPFNILCKPPRDALPDPEAIALTGISIAECERDGLKEFDFAQTISDIFSEPDTCIVGYNSLRFDDEFLRNLFYRNLMDPYAREWQHGRTRWDLIDTVRLCRALRPDGIEWPLDENGTPNNRLENLTAANGLSHEAAHDALSDVTATIAVARLLNDRQPKLYRYAFDHRDKRSAASLLDPYKPEPVLHISGMYGSANAYTALVLPVAMHPTNKNGVLVADLRHSAEPYQTLGADELRSRWFATKEVLGDTPRFPVKTIHLNRCPVLAPVSVLRGADSQRLGLDLDTARRNVGSWQHAALQTTILDITAAPEHRFQNDAELQIYSGGFFSSQDRALMARVVSVSPHTLKEVDPAAFTDMRLPVLLNRLRARNWPETLTPDELEQWRGWVSQAIDDRELRCINRTAFNASVQRIRVEQPDAAHLMTELVDHYAEWLS